MDDGEDGEFAFHVGGDAREVTGWVDGEGDDEEDGGEGEGDTGYQNDCGTGRNRQVEDDWQQDPAPRLTMAKSPA